MQLLVCQSQGTDPYRNLALEEALLQTVGQDQCILYLWRNEHTVVIGRNQNPWVQCRTNLLQAEGGKLARRLSGGGAVYHDLGNLNFTFLMPQTHYDVDRQLLVIEAAVADFGITTQRSGRNDVLAQGRKFSGSAFYKHGGKAYHHGTLLVSADLERLGRYLSPSKAKLQSKGVESVRSRVGNLSQLCPQITVSSLKSSLIHAFSAVYGHSVGEISPDLPLVEELRQRYESWQWNFGQRLPFTACCEARFSWGELRLEFQVVSGVICGLGLDCDAMDWQLPGALQSALVGCPFTLEAMSKRVNDLNLSQGAEILALLRQQL